MQKVQADQEKRFRQVMKGDQSALVDLLEAERSNLFDYLMRLTGQVARSLESTDEVFVAITKETIETLASYADLKICIYATARRFNADIWNADISRLLNAALTPRPPTAPDVLATEVADPKAAMAIDKAMRALSGEQREVVLLSLIVGFDLAEISEITGKPERNLEQLLSQGLVLLRQELVGITDVSAYLKSYLALHPQPIRSSQMTLNLSMLMQGIKTKPVGLWSPVRIAVLATMLSLVALWLVYPSMFSRIAEILRATLPGNDR